MTLQCLLRDHRHPRYGTVEDLEAGPVESAACEDIYIPGKLGKLPREVFDMVLVECTPAALTNLAATSHAMRHVIDRGGEALWERQAEKLGPIRIDAEKKVFEDPLVPRDDVPDSVAAGALLGWICALLALDVGLAVGLAPKNCSAGSNPWEQSDCEAERVMIAIVATVFGGGGAVVIGGVLGVITFGIYGVLCERQREVPQPPPVSTKARDLFDGRVAVLRALGTRFLNAVMANDERTVQRMLDAGFTPTVAYRGVEPVAYAIRCKSFAVAQKLLAAGITPTEPKTATLALENGASPTLLTMLVNAGAPPTAEICKWAVEKGRLDIVKKLRAATNNPKALLAKLPEERILIDALERGFSHQFLDTLIRMGARVNPEQPCYTTPLHTAVKLHRVGACSLLLAHGARWYVKDADGLDAWALARLHPSAFPFAQLPRAPGAQNQAAFSP